MKNKNLKGLSTLTSALVIIIILSAFVFLFLAGLDTGKRSIVLQGEDNFETGWNAAKEKLRTSGAFPNEAETLTSLRGNIVKIEGNKIHFTSRQVVRNPLKIQAPTERIAIVSKSTKIIAKIRKNPQVIEKEREAYKQKLKNTKTLDLEPPSSYTIQEIKISDLKANDVISIESNINIKLLKEFTATEISIYRVAMELEPKESASVEAVPEPLPEPEEE